ncbi:MAG: tetratricopeptide repeat protein, partial [Deltaproteobacteria bacterium]|nr:tetratricopeptide repeat protein [Deltaproteobacteria bacterium]
MPSRSLVCASLLAIATAGRADGPLLQLEVGKPLSRPTQGGTAERYAFTLPQGGFARLRVDQGEAGVRVSLDGPDDKELDWTDETGTGGTEYIATLGGPAGVYKLVVRNLGPPEYQGPVVITLDEARAARPGDDDWVKADLTFREANVQRRKQDQASTRKALDLFTTAMALYNKSGDWRREAESTNRRGQMHMTLNEYQLAHDDFEVARNLSHVRGDQKFEATCSHNMARVELAWANPLLAKDMFERVLKMRRESGDTDGEAYTMYYLGQAWAALGEPEKALALWEQVLPIHTRHFDQLGRIMTWNAMARLQTEAGAFQQALANYDLALDHARDEQRNPQGVAAATSLHGMARIHLELGDLENARRLCDEALTIARRLKNQGVLATNLELSGQLQLAAGDAAGAVRSLEEARTARIALQDRPGEAKVQNSIGRALSTQGDHAGALARYELAMQIATELGNKQLVADTLLLESREQFALRKFDEAEKAAAGALPLYQGGGARLGEGNALHELARAQHAQGKDELALQNVAKAIEQFESLRGLIDSPELRALWRATTQGAYELWIELLMRRHAQKPDGRFDEQALLANERARARGLLESLGHARAGLRQDAPVELLKQRAELSRRANALEFKRVSALTSRLVQPPDPDELQAVLNDERELEAKILTASPRYAAVTLPPEVTLASLQKELGADTVLLELTLGERASFAWLVSADGLTSVTLPGREAIEAQARALHEALTARNSTVADATVALRRARLDKADAEAARQARLLADTILTPFAKALGKKRLVVVADGALRLVPFAALPDPVGKRPLAAAHEIVSLPSAAVLAELRRSEEKRAVAAPSIAVIADPVYAADDERVKKPGQKVELLASNEVVRAARDAGLLGYSRLRFSREEAEAVQKL